MAKLHTDTLEVLRIVSSYHMKICEYINFCFLSLHLVISSMKKLL